MGIRRGMVLAFAVILLSGISLAAAETDDLLDEAEDMATSRTEQQQENIFCLSEDPFPFSVATASDTISKLGSPVKLDVGEYRVFEDASEGNATVRKRDVRVCYKGLDICYVQLRYDDRYREFWSSMKISDPGYMLKPGIAVGMGVSELFRLLGEPDKRENGRWFYRFSNADGTSGIYVTAQDGKVRSIDLEFPVE